MVVALAGAIALFASGTVALPAQEVLVVRGMIGSKRDFFQDPEVKRLLMAHRIQVQMTPVGSRELVNRDDLDDYDFVFPSGQSMVEVVYERRKNKSTNPYRPFFTPIVLATYADYARALRDAGVVREQGDGDGLYYDLSVPALIKVMQQGRFWSDLGTGNNNRVITQIPDPCRTYSGATYVGMLAFALNDNHPPTDDEAAVRLAREIKPLLDVEGQHGDDHAPKYLAPDGRTFGTVVVIYEHQFLAHQLAVVERTGQPDRTRALLYPEAQHETAPELLAFTPAGNRLGHLISEEPALRRRALELGFRVLGPSGETSDYGALSEHLRARGLPTPTSGIGDTETWLPNRKLLERMILEVGGCA
ncbi:hypothetical protein AB0I60_04690 [Actinosynnema sp. NPDC050436]|uniref:hypothetical protein n=1 Tax=Actinosynnema sp. NPDC050436 TaxID=3155659 RepID=UPI0033EC50D0